VATRKQRRRREKDIRHEFVWEDEEGNPVEPPAKEERAEREKAKTAAPARGRMARGIQPPSWQRVAKRAAIFGPLMLVLVFALPAKNGSRTGAITTALIFIAIFIPFSYLMDSMMWRSYQKRLNKPPKDEAKSAGKPGGKRR
jgi:hypothetical protein